MSENDLFILWSTADRDVALETILVYALNAKKNRWFDNVELCIWGPSVKLAATDEEILVNLTHLRYTGVRISSCKACATNYGLVDKLEQIYVDVKYMGEPLTENMKDGTKVLTF